MKKGVKNQTQGKSLLDIEKEITVLKKEMARMHLEHRITMPKDTNIISKKRRRLAVLSAIINSERRKKAIN